MVHMMMFMLYDVAVDVGVGGCDVDGGIDVCCCVMRLMMLVW